jgi:BirA family biotin operon repressor/biotin-[acetyl-CoA-carboxylase] ligase
VGGKERVKSSEIEMNEGVIELLKGGNGFISGEEASRALGITRAGFWKRVRMLRQNGYVIEAVPSKGYRLLASPDMPTKDEIRAVFRGDIIGKEIVFYGVTTSTNDRAIELGQSRKSLSARAYNKDLQETKDAVNGTVIIADSQERGRGRFDRNWISPPGVNLYFTVLLEPPFSSKEVPVITLMAAVAVVSAIRENVGLNAEIKWPNDILIRNKKVGGILTEMKSDIDRINFIAVGIGLNVNMPVTMLPRKLRSLSTSLIKEKTEPVNRVELLGTILSKLEYWYKLLLKGNKNVLLKEWLSLNSTVGKKVMVKSYDRVITGMAEGISADGELVVRLSSGAVEKIHAGEVTIVKN